MTIPARITREYLLAHPQWNFVHSTNIHHTQRVGPAKVCSGLPNCFGVPVRWSLCRSSGHFQDHQIEEFWPAIEAAIKLIPDDKPIILFPKIGNGHSRMHILAPKAWEQLSRTLKVIAIPVRYEYT